MKNITLLVFLFLIKSSCFSQGGWDIGYIEIDSVNHLLIGKDVKLDFKSESDTVKTIPRFLITFLGIEDSVNVTIGNNEFLIHEKRNIHADWGFYEEQFLEFSPLSKNSLRRIYHSVIEQETKDSILIRLYIEVYSKIDSGELSIKSPRRFCVSEWIPRAKLNGVMFKR